MAFPFLFLTTSFSAGILTSRYLSPSLPISVVGLSVCLVLAWIFYVVKKLKFSFLLAIIATFFLGSGLFSYFDSRYERNALRSFPTGTYMDFYGTLSKSPGRSADRDFLYLKVSRVDWHNRTEKIKGNLRISVHLSPDSGAPLLLTGDKVKIAAALLPSKGYRNFKEPTLANYLQTQNIHALAISKSPLLVEKLGNGFRFSPLRLMSAVRQRLQQNIETHFPAPEEKPLSSQGAILEALLLGERGRMDNEATLALQKSGLFHLIAISGAHIAIIAFLLFGLFRLLRIPRRASYLVLMIILVLYALLVEGRASVFRAIIMTFAFLLGKLLWRDSHLINAISLSAFFLLLINPYSLFDMGFELTYAATFSIILFFSKVMSVLPRLPLKISETFALSLTAQAGVLPFIAGTFHRVTFSAIILNFIAIPLVGLIMALGFIFCLLSSISALLGKWLAVAISFLIDVLMRASHLLDGIAVFSYRIPSPPPFVIAGYFLLLLLLLPRFRSRWPKTVAVAGFILFLGLLVTYPFPSFSRHLRLTFIDVGQGESILVEFPGKKKMLVDGGGQFQGTFDVGENVVSPVLWNKGIKRIDYLVLTHGHPDHLNGLVSVAQNFKIGEFWDSFSPRNDENYQKLKKNLRRRAYQRRIFRGFTYRVGDVAIKALHPQEGPVEVDAATNSQSLVLFIAYGQTRFLLTSDIGVEEEAMILEKGNDIRSQLLKSPHHGSLSSSSQIFLDRVAPEMIILSVGEGNSFGFPHREIIERYSASGARILRTDFHGAIEVSSDGRELSFRTAVKSPEQR